MPPFGLDTLAIAATPILARTGLPTPTATLLVVETALKFAEVPTVLMCTRSARPTFPTPQPWSPRAGSVVSETPRRELLYQSTHTATTP